VRVRNSGGADRRKDRGISARAVHCQWLRDGDAFGYPRPPFTGSVTSRRPRGKESSRRSARNKDGRRMVENLMPSDSRCCIFDAISPLGEFAQAGGNNVSGKNIRNAVRPGML